MGAGGIAKIINSAYEAPHHFILFHNVLPIGPIANFLLDINLSVWIFWPRYQIGNIRPQYLWMSPHLLNPVITKDVFRFGKVADKRQVIGR